MKVVKNDLFDYGLEKKKDINTIIDFCSGNGAVPLILSTKTTAKIKGFEIQKNPYKLAYNSIKLNNLEYRIKMINDNLNNSLEYILPETVDVITCNPPYFKYKKDSNINEIEEKAIARHEIETNLDSIVMSARYILKNKGILYMVHRPERLAEIFSVLDHYKFAVKKLQFIYSTNNKNALMVLIKATKNGQDGLIVNPPINVMKYNSYKGIFD